MKNFIFYLVSKIIKTNATILSDWHIEQGKKTPDSLAPYYFHLPLEDEENFSLKISEENHTLRLTEHHITIHELQTQEHVQYKSPYHYTAIFKNENEEKNRLHLFFNSKDKICCATFSKFSIISQSYTDTVTLDTPSISQFELFSKSFILNFISKIRVQQNFYISQLTEQCTSFNIQAEELSKNITAENVQFYIENLEKYITVLQEIKQLSGENNQGIQNILLRRGYELKKQFSTSNITPRLVDQRAETKDEDIDLSDAVIFHPAPLRLSVAPMDLDPKIILLKTQVEWLETRFAKQLIPTIIEQYLTVYNDYLKLSSEITLCTHDTTVSMSGLSIFEKIASQLTIKGTALLQKAILENSFQEAAKLNMFHSTMPLKYLNMALMIGNAPMLEFLLNYGPYGIDTQAITTSKIDYQSILHYLIEGELKIESKIACFQILMKQGASLLTCNQDGLPWAHFLLSKTNACTQALYSNIPTDILHSRAFYKQLIVLLSSQNSNPKINAALIDYAKHYSSLVSLGTDTDLRMKKLISDTLSRQSDFKEQFGAGFLSEVKMSSEMQSLQALLECSILECKNLMTKEQWIKIGAAAKTSQKDILESGLLKQTGEQGFLAVKDSVKTYYLDTIEYWKNLTVVIQLDKKHASKSCPSKALKRSMNQRNRLVQSLKKYEEKYNIQKELQTCTLLKSQERWSDTLKDITASLNAASEALKSLKDILGEVE